MPRDISDPSLVGPVFGPRVSILLLASSRPQLIDRAIQSVLAQEYQEWELIIVQDGPNKLIEAILSEWVRRDKRIRYFLRGKSNNLASTYNFGIARARGEYIAILDDDDFWLAAHKLRRQVALLDTHAEYVGCGGGMVVVDETGNELMRYLKPEYDETIKRRALLANPMAHSTMMFRRLVGGQVNLYNEALAGLSDWDMWLSLGRHGKLYNFPELFTCYTLWKYSASFQRHRDNAKAALRIVWRHRAWYPCVDSAIAVALISALYSYLPAFIRRHSFTYLSCLKKMLFANSVAPKSSSRSCSLIPPAQSKANIDPIQGRYA